MSEDEARVCAWCEPWRAAQSEQRHWCAARDGYHELNDCPCTGRHYR